VNFEDEPYVRLYTRDTKTWLKLGFEGRVVLSLTLRKLDRAGVLDDIEDAADLALIIDAPAEFVRLGFARCVELDVFRLVDKRLVMPRYAEAQNCRQSDKLRKQESRARRRSAALEPVTTRDSPSQDVTESHQQSPAVTVGHSIRADLSRTELSATRTLALPCEDPPEDYLEQARMEFTPIEQAKATWRHYWAEGLPPNGVVRLYPWLLKQAREFHARTVRAPRLEQAKTLPGLSGAAARKTLEEFE
jgi:hypothetical protein